MSMLGITELVILCVVGLILAAIVGAVIFMIVRKQRSPAEGIPCPSCGSLNPPENKFCSNCGGSL